MNQQHASPHAPKPLDARPRVPKAHATPVLALLSALAVMHSTVQAEIMIGESIEWLVDSSPVVAVYRVNGVQSVDAGISGLNLDLTLQQTFKGTAPNKIRRFAASHTVDASRPSNGQDLLLFLDGNDNKLRYHINLSRPAGKGFVSIAFSKSFDVLTDQERIIDTVKKRTQLEKQIQDPTPINNLFAEEGNGAIRMEVPSDSVAHKALYAGSSCFLVLPADPELRTTLVKMTRSKDAFQRQAGARSLVAYPSPETVVELEKLLEDPFVTLSQKEVNGKKTKIKLYPVRDQAQQSIQQIKSALRRDR